MPPTTVRWSSVQGEGPLNAPGPAVVDDDENLNRRTNLPFTVQAGTCLTARPCEVAPRGRAPGCGQLLRDLLW